MGKSKKKNKNHGKAIRGDTTPFEKTDFEKMSQKMKHGVLIEDELIMFRNLSKEAFASRMKKAAKLGSCYETISEKSLKIINTYLNSWTTHPSASSYVSCFFESYNDRTLNTINNPKCMTTVREKAFKHGVKDCSKAFTEYIKPIVDRLTNENLAPLFNDELIGKFTDIKASLGFAANYIEALYCEEMPEKISSFLFDECYKIDCDIEKCYVFHKSTNTYELSKNALYKSISQECATYLICHKHLSSEKIV